MLEHYQTLNLQEGATAEEIEEAYRRLISAWAPNKHRQHAQATTTAIGKTLAIMAAYRTLMPQIISPITIKTYQDIVSREDYSTCITSFSYDDLLQSLKSNFHLILKIWGTNYHDKLILVLRLHTHDLLKPVLLDSSNQVDNLATLLSQVGNDRNYRDQLYHLILSINEESLLKRMFCFFVLDNDQDRITDMLTSCPHIYSPDVLNTALSIAVSSLHHDLISLLLTLGANPNIRMPSGATPLHHMVFQGNKILCEQLLAKGANINATDLYQQTPLYVAVSKCHQDIATLLLAQGANMEHSTKTGATALKLIRQNKTMHQLLLLNSGKHENTPPTLPQTEPNKRTKRH